MAAYLGNYRDDFGNISSFILLDVYQINDISQSPTRSATSIEFDSQYLPAVWLGAVTPKTKAIKYACTTGDLTMRSARLFITNTAYLHVDLPFSPAQSEFEQFFREASANVKIVNLGLQGEKVRDFYLRKYALT